MVYEPVPKMKLWLDDRMAQLRVTRSDLIKRTGLSGPGIDPLLRGDRKRYQSRLKWPICDALQFTEDSIDRMLRGDPPIPVEGAPPIRISLAEADALVTRAQATTEGLGALLDDATARRSPRVRRREPPAR